MSSALINALVGDLEQDSIPAAIKFLQQVQTNDKLPVALIPASDALALAQLNQDLLAQAPNLFSQVTSQITNALIAKLQSIKPPA